MSMGDYLFYSLMGICVVFFALILLMCIIKIMMLFQPREKAGAAAAASGAAAGSVADGAKADKALAPGSAGDLKLYDTDPRDAAMIMAIVADELQKPLNELRFISIKEVKK